MLKQNGHSVIPSFQWLSNRLVPDFNDIQQSEQPYIDDIIAEMFLDCSVLLILLCLQIRKFCQ